MIRPLRLLAAALCLALVSSVSAQPKVTRIIVAFSPGGPVDLVARAISEQLGRELGRTVVVDYKPGANGAIGAQEVMRAEADGGTLWLTSVGAAAINPVLYEKLPYSMQRDFAPVSLVVNNDELLATSPSYPAKDAAEFVAAAKKRAEPTPMASSGIGSIPHLAIEQLEDATGAKLLHVPYKGAAPAIADVMGGQVAAWFGDVPGMIGLIRAGKLKPLGMAAKKRHPVLPEVRTLEEQGIAGVDTNNWYALFVSARTPPAVVEALNKAVRATLATPAVREKLLSMGADPAASSPQELAAMLKADTEKWGRLIKAKNVKAE
ncbi:MAG: tripartite tricarboxylate transporter substrate binding protein [Burkholderiaceae bacterium]